MKLLVRKCSRSVRHPITNLIIYQTGAAAHRLDMEKFRAAGHDPFVRHFEDPGPHVHGCPFSKDPTRHFHDTSPPERLVMPRSRIWSSKELDARRRDARRQVREKPMT